MSRPGISSLSNLTGHASGSLGPLPGGDRRDRPEQGLPGRSSSWLYYLVMHQRFLAPLVSWDGLHLELDIGIVESHLRTWLCEREEIQYVGLEGAGDAVRLWLSVVFKGVAVKLGVELAEIRMKRRHLGLRFRRVKVLGGVPVPRAVVEQLIEWLAPGMITVISGEGIVVVNLGRWIPSELELEILTVQASDRALHLWLGPGSLLDIPGAARPALSAGSAAEPRAVPVGTG